MAIASAILLLVVSLRDSHRKAVRGLEI